MTCRLQSAAAGFGQNFKSSSSTKLLAGACFYPDLPGKLNLKLAVAKSRLPAVTGIFGIIADNTSIIHKK